MSGTKSPAAANAPDRLAGIQRAFAAHLRNPGRHAAPVGIEARRMRVYADLVYKNIDSFLATGFPVIRKLLGDSEWQALVREFVAGHSCHTPYFTRIGAEFVQFLASGDAPGCTGRPYLAELAQYEWAEQALFLSADELPPSRSTAGTAALSRASVRLSPLAWPMVFSYPVHEIGPGHEPAAPAPQPVCLVVYRNAADEVNFLQLEPFGARLLEMLDERDEATPVQDLLSDLQAEAPGLSPQTLEDGVLSLLASLHDLDIIRLA